MTSQGRYESRSELVVATLIATGALLLLVRAPLDTPYWWDAAAVYVPGSRWVADHDFLAFPGQLPSLLGRGHTTLFYLIVGVAFGIFGHAPVVGHTVVLGFGVMGLVYTYRLASLLFGRAAGVAAALLLGVSPLYLTMSAQVLPEAPLAALCAASLYEFARGRYATSMVFGIAVVLLKETGVACPLAIVAALVLWGWRRRDLTSIRGPALWAAVPVLVLAAFFVFQRVTEGWWVLPFHAELFDMEHDYLRQGAGVAMTMVGADGRAIASVAAVGLLAWRLRRSPESFGGRADTDGAPPRWVVLVALVLMVLANQGFFTKMWFLERYALAAHPAVVVLLAGALVPHDPFGRFRGISLAGSLAVAAAAAVGLSSAYGGEGYASGETTFRYLHMIDAHREVYEVLESGDEPPLVLTAWPMTSELRDPGLGFVRRPYEAIGIDGYRDGSDEIQRGRPIEAIVTAEGLGSHPTLVEEARRLGLGLRHRARRGGAVVELWMAGESELTPR